MDATEQLKEIMVGAKSRCQMAAQNFASVLATEIPRESEEDFRRHKEPWRTGHIADEIEVKIASEGPFHIVMTVNVGYPWVHVEKGTKYGIRARNTVENLYESMRSSIESYIAGDI